MLSEVVREPVKQISVLNEEIFISESLAISMSQQIDSIVTLAALIGYEVKIERSNRRLTIEYLSREQESKKYTLYLFLTPGRVLSSTYLFNEFGIDFHSKNYGLIGPVEKLKELL